MSASARRRAAKKISIPQVRAVLREHMPEMYHSNHLGTKVDCSCGVGLGTAAPDTSVDKAHAIWISHVANLLREEV